MHDGAARPDVSALAAPRAAGTNCARCDHSAMALDKSPTLLTGGSHAAYGIKQMLCRGRSNSDTEVSLFMARKKKENIVADGHKVARDVRRADSAVYMGEAVASGNPKRIERYFLRKLFYKLFAKFTNRTLSKV